MSLLVYAGKKKNDGSTIGIAVGVVAGCLVIAVVVIGYLYFR